MDRIRYASFFLALFPLTRHVLDATIRHMLVTVPVSLVVHLLWGEIAREGVWIGNDALLSGDSVFFLVIHQANW